MKRDQNEPQLQDEQYLKLQQLFLSRPAALFSLLLYAEGPSPPLRATNAPTGPGIVRRSLLKGPLGLYIGL